MANEVISLLKYLTALILFTILLHINNYIIIMHYVQPKSQINNCIIIIWIYTVKSQINS